MANDMLLDDTRALRREQREARIARKHERRAARALKREHHPLALETLALEPPLAPAPSPEEPANTAQPAAEKTAQIGSVPAIEDAPATIPERPARDGAKPTVTQIETPRPRPQHEGRRESGRQRDVAKFLERRDEKVSLAREKAKERIARLGEEDAVCDALGAIAHPEASPWHQHRERLSEALATRRIPEIGAAARRGCRGAASDAARTSRRAPNADDAQAVAEAFAVIARAPWAAIRGPRAERSAPRREPPTRPFWH